MGLDEAVLFFLELGNLAAPSVRVGRSYQMRDHRDCPNGGIACFFPSEFCSRHEHTLYTCGGAFLTSMSACPAARQEHALRATQSTVPPETTYGSFNMHQTPL